MTVGTKVRFTYKNKSGVQQSTLTLSTNILGEDVISNEAVHASLNARLRQTPIETLVEMGYIFAARNLLRMVPDAREISMQEEKESQEKGNNGDAFVGLLILAVVAVIVAIICFPLMVILGMHNKLFLKGFYNKYEDEKFKAFTKKYTFIGIGLYALVAVLVIIGYIFTLPLLTTTLPFGILFFGGVAYFVISLLYIKKKFLPEGEKINVLQTFKEGFKKKEKNKDKQ